MSNSIDNQTWQMVEAINFSVQEEKKTQKQSEERIAQVHHLNNLQRIEKDVVLPADPHGRTAVGKGKKGAETKPKLPNPTTKWSGLQSGDNDEPGLIAIMGKVLALQAKTNSNFWSTLWKQASKSMMMEVKFAPIIGNAIRSQYKAESLATQAQADQSKYDGIVNLTMFGASMVLAGVMEFKEPTEETSTDDTKEFSEEGTNPGETTEEITDSSINETDKELDDENKSNKSRAKKTWEKAKDVMNKSQKRLTGVLGKGMQASMMMSMASQGITGFFIDSKYQGKQAIYQGQQGQAAALSKEAEQYAQFYGQAFSRSEDLRQGSGQNIDYAMNILKSAADSITQTVTSMFRG